MQIPCVEIVRLDTLETGPCGKEFVLVAHLQFETLAQAGLVQAGIRRHSQAGDRRPMSRLAPRCRIAAEAQIVTEVESVAVVFALAHAPHLESAGDVVLGDPDLVVAVCQVGRVNHFHPVGHVLADRQPRRWIGFIGDEHGLDSDFADAGRAFESAPELRADATREVRECLHLGDFGFFAAHLVNRTAGYDERHDVGLGKRWF